MQGAMDVSYPRHFRKTLPRCDDYAYVREWIWSRALEKLIRSMHRLLTKHLGTSVQTLISQASMYVTNVAILWFGNR